MKKLLFAFSFILSVSAVMAQSDTTYWNNEGNFSVQFNRVSFSNWAAGGNNSYAGVVGLNYAFAYAKDKTTWDNKIIASYGMQSLDGEFRKTEDKIDLASKFGYELTEKTYAAVLASLKSQFAKGYNYPDVDTYLSKFAAPMYVAFGAGLDYKPNKFVSVYFSPATLQWVIVSDPYLSSLGSFGNDPGQKVRTQAGANLKVQITKEILKNITLDTKAEFFSDYLNQPQNIMVNWDFALDMKVNEWISAKFTTGMIYDHNITIYNADGVALGPRTQWKEMFGAGLSVKF